MPSQTVAESTPTAKRAKCTFARISLGKSSSFVCVLVGNVFIHASRFYAACGFLHEEYKAETGRMVGGTIVDGAPLTNPKAAYWMAIEIASRNSATVEVH